MTSEHQLTVFEHYLSELNAHLVRLGADPRRRVEHLEQAADILLSTDTDPQDEFGPADVFAADLAAAEGSSTRQPWLRVAACAAGGVLLIEGMLGFFQAREFPELRYAILFPQVAFPAMIFGLVAWMQLTPTGTRLAFNGAPGPRVLRSRGAGGGLLVLALIAASALGLIIAAATLPIATQIETWADNKAAAPWLAGAAAAGLGLIWLSGIVKLHVAALRTRTRPGSAMTYSSLRQPAVQLQRTAMSGTR